MVAKKTTITDKQTVSFEQALQRLESIVRDMEGGSLSLDTMIQRFEEGQSLIGLCNRKLNEVERKIEMLVKKDGETVAVPFGEDAGGDDPSGGDDNTGDARASKDGDGIPF